ncbi:hypothetical protein LUZ61_019999 [Rhynchospora tenuis]|uniref:Uncharacterized protein n=1 Tax=Rhynchospora tenuis TaxID=198213 RepID=A0AAD5ZC68_9POAL|nr:hypothetical protein LUZ61_019999 [Rhynchospora tenuis]
MLSPKKLIQMAKKWQRLAAQDRRRLAFERKNPDQVTDQCTSPRSEKGNFVVYTIDGKRFTIPLDYLKNKIVMKLFELSEEEFGYTVDGPITLPCEGAFMDYAIDLVQRGVSEEIERALLGSVSLSCHHGQSNFGLVSQQVAVCGF